MEIRLTDDQAVGDSMLEEIRRTAERRLRQIEPLLEEAQRLQDVLKVLGARPDASTVGEGSAHLPDVASVEGDRELSREPATRPLAPAGNRTVPARAAKGSNKRAILELVDATPGITSARIAELTGMKRTVVASTVSRLKRYGELVDHHDGGVCIPARAELSSHADRDAEAFAAPTASVPAKSATSVQRARHLASLHRRHAA